MLGLGIERWLSLAYAFDPGTDLEGIALLDLEDNPINIKTGIFDWSQFFVC
ncbi:MAG: hypothetical protein HXS41_10750 [Theionarchaea archaeon]|nr:hypothetical protein [Theionarchaea archaeon]MBU7001497.1 hypothetical protein [Theionarchaea archaeon]MBU7021525.1 hypothetical protein [Theionarchaea archaeon]MBU7041427.1 hypothetical protein [Theionarchaea archaeon]